MRLCRSYALWLALCATFSGCTQVVDFDRHKIQDGIDMADGAVLPPEGGAPGGGMDASAMQDAAPHDAYAPLDTSVEAGRPCMRNDQCGSDELCCGQECRKTSLAQCASCETGCTSSAASGCRERSCACGAEAECRSPAPYCLPKGSVSACAECNDVKDCQGRSDGKTQCVEGRCTSCNPADNAGCSGNTPICNPSSHSCERCSANPDNCPGSLVCTASGACGGCSNAANDCTNPTSPICDGATTECRACTQGPAGDRECSTQRQRPYCEAGRCGSCRPEGDTGCDQASTKPDCRTNGTGQYECQGCASNADCAGASRSLCNTSTGSCVECASDDNCTDPAKPYCDLDGTCKGCGAVGANALANIWCIANTLTLRPVCDRPSGRCVRCTANTGCNGQCRVDSAAPQNNVCVGCINNAGCSGNSDRCDTARMVCIDCDASGGCSGNEQCLIGANSSANQCVDCIDSSGCSGVRSRCDTASHTCVECTQASHCNDPDACTVDSCESGVCRHEARSTEDGFSCTDGRCDPASGVISQIPVHERCAPDSDLCTIERCIGTAGTQPTGCGSEPAPACDAGSCDPATGMCMP